MPFFVLDKFLNYLAIKILFCYNTNMFTIFQSIQGSNFTTSQILAFILGYLFAIIIAFSMHEFAHAFTAYKLGDPTPKAMGRLTLNPLKHLDPMGMIAFLIFGFGWAKPVQINPMNFKKYRRDMFLVSIAGVFTNIVLAFIFSCLYMLFFNIASMSNSLMYFIGYFIEYSLIINIALFIFNLLPIYPLDGFNILKSVCKLNNKFLNFMYKYGGIIMLVFLITPLFDIIYYGTTSFIVSVFFRFWGLFV